MIYSNVPKSKLDGKFIASYLEEAFLNTDDLLTKPKNLLDKIDFDTIVATGISGMLIAPQLACITNKFLLVVRKPDDGHHSYRPATGYIGKKWIFVDDLIHSGRTLKNVISTVASLEKDYYPSIQTEFLGAFLYTGFATGIPHDDSSVSAGWNPVESLTRYM